MLHRARRFALSAILLLERLRRKAAASAVSATVGILKFDRGAARSALACTAVPIVPRRVRRSRVLS